MKIEWSSFAMADRIAIFDLIESDNPKAAVEVDLRIQQAVEGLGGFPQMGRVGRVAGTRELVIPHSPYLVAYRLVGESVQVLRLLHGARQWPESI